MTERIILELKSKLITQQDQKKYNEINNYLFENQVLNTILKDIEITLNSLNYPKKEIKNINKLLIDSIKNEEISFKETSDLSFEKLLKEAMNYLDNKNSNLDQLHSKME